MGKGKKGSSSKKGTHIPAGTVPPTALELDVGSLKLTDKPNIAGDSHQCLEADGFDDGGVADLSLLIDLDDMVIRRKKGDEVYFAAKDEDTLPRVFNGGLKDKTRKEQKVELAQLLFSEIQGDEDRGPSEVFNDTKMTLGEDEQEDVKKHRLQRARMAQNALRLAMILKEPPCASLALTQMCLRTLGAEKDSGEKALRLAEKALKIAGDGMWDADAVALEAEDRIPDGALDRPANDTVFGLSHPDTLKICSARVGLLCKRAGYLQKGNALATLKRYSEARESYEEVLKLLSGENRCSRADWERHSLRINIGNMWNKSGNFDKAKECYDLAEQLGNDYLTHEKGSKSDGHRMVHTAKKYLAWALKQNGQEAEARKILQTVLEESKVIMEEEKKKAAELRNKEEQEKAEKEGAP